MAQVANLNTRLSLESASFISGIEKSRGAVRSLIASLDPAAAAQAKFNRETQLLEGALKRGQISAEAYGKGMDILRQRMTAAATAGGGVVTSSGAQRAGFQQLGFQIGDIATQYGSGTKAMTIFAQQSGQVIQALGMMTQSTKGLLGFLGGPWGQILTAAAIVMVPLINKLFESADAGHAAADGVKDYITALKSLQDQGGAFKFSSDEFRKVSVSALEAEAKVSRLRKELSTVGSGGPMIVTPGGTAPANVGRSREIVTGDLARAQADATRLRGDVSALLKQRSNRENLDRDAPPKERKSRTSKGPADRSDQRLERYDDQLAQLQQQRLGLLQGITADVREQAQYQHDQVDATLESFKTDLEHQVKQKEITAEKAKELLTAKERNTELEHTKINWALDDKLTEQDLQVTQSRLDNATELLRGDLDAARTQSERRRIQLAILENERQEQVAALEAVKAKHSSTDIEYKVAQAKLDQLGKETSQRAGAITRSTMGPLDQFLDRMPKNAEELNEAYQDIAADGLKSLNDGLTEAIMGSKTLADVFKNVANQIIADLIRIAIQKAVVQGLGNALSGMLGGSGLTTSHAGAGNVKNFASGGSFMVGGRPGVDNHMLSVDGIPRARVSHNELVGVGYGSSSGSAKIEIVENPMFASRVVGISGDVSIRTQSAANAASAKRATRRLA